MKQLIAVGALVTSAFVIVAACGGETEDNPTGNADAGASSSSGSSTSSSTSSGSSSGSSTSSSGGTSDDASADSSTTTSNCTTDPECNFQPEMSSLAGQCFKGLCFCKEGFNVQPNGKCGPTQPPTCTEQAGTCAQGAAVCPTGQLRSNASTNMTCGDLIVATCCFAEAACKGSTEVACCSKTNGSTPPLCVNGWRTCESSESPIDKSAVCN